MTDRRDATCVQRWPDCESGLYDPRCCRFPKSCSCESTGWADNDPWPIGRSLAVLRAATGEQPGIVEVPTVAGFDPDDYITTGAICAPLSPIYGERQTMTTRYLTDDDRRNLHLLVHTERLRELRKYAKALLGVIDERRAMDPDRRPVAEALPAFSFGRDVPPILVEIKPAEYDELRHHIDELTKQHNLANIDDPYEAVYTAATADLAALYYLVNLVRNIIDRAGPPPATGRGGIKTIPTPGVEIRDPR